MISDLFRTSTRCCTASTPSTRPHESLRVSRERRGSLATVLITQGSIWDTLLRNGPISFGIRVARPDFYEETVVTYMETKGVDRLEAQRRMDFMFNDPNGFGVNELREEQMGEKINYNIKSGVQNRPVFSAFWAAWCFYFFFIFLPARVSELGGIDFTPSKFDIMGPYN